MKGAKQLPLFLEWGDLIKERAILRRDCILMIDNNLINLKISHT